MRMLSSTRRTILAAILGCPADFVTVGDIMKKVDVSRKTVSLEIQKLDEFLAPWNARIETAPGKGYRIVAADPVGFEAFRKQFLRHEKRDRYMDFDRYYLSYMMIMTIILRDDYVSIDEFAEMFHYSRGTISNSVPLMKHKLAQFGCTVHSRPGYGLGIQGSEWQKRVLILFYAKIASGIVFMQADHMGVAAAFRALVQIRENDEGGYFRLKPLIEGVLERNGFMLPLTCLQQLCFYIFVSRTRSDKYSQVEFSAADLRRLRPTRYFAAAQELAGRLREHGIVMQENDIIAMAILLDCYATRRSTHELDDYQLSLCRSDTEMYLRRVAELYPGIEQYFDEPFKEEFTCWLAGVHERQFFGLPCDREAVYSISRDGLFYSELCCDFAVLYKELYRVELSETELLQAYYIIAAAHRRNLAASVRLNIAVALNYGGHYASYVAQRIRRRYSHSIDHIETFEVGQVGAIDPERFHVLVTDVDANQIPGCPIPVVTLDIERSGISRNLNQFFTDYNKAILEKVVDPGNCMYHTRLGSIDEVFDYLADNFVLEAHRGAFVKDMQERNGFISCAKQNGIALITADAEHCPDNNVRILINKTPINWQGTQVRMILFSARRHLPYKTARIPQMLYRQLLSDNAEIIDLVAGMTPDELVNWAVSRDYSQ